MMVFRAYSHCDYADAGLCVVAAVYNYSMELLRSCNICDKVGYAIEMVDYESMFA